MRCNDCHRDMENYEITFKDPIRFKDVCETCSGTYGFDCSIGKWGKAVGNESKGGYELSKRWTSETTVYQIINENKFVKRAETCHWCSINRAKTYGYEDHKFIPICIECQTKDKKKEEVKGWL